MNAVVGAGDGGLECFDGRRWNREKMVVAQVCALFLGGGLVERRNFDSMVLLAVMVMPAIKAVKKATSGHI